MIAHPFFSNKLKQIESILDPENNYYQLGNFRWPTNIQELIEQCKYPTEYFIKMISNTIIINNYIVNPPIICPPNKIVYIPLNHNNLLILDALFQQGSNPRYENNEKYIYSEHSGVISIKNNTVESINVSTNTNRIDETDNNIFLPYHEKNSYQYKYIFHTHPNMIKYAGRIDDGVLYEFPSASDVMYFMQCYNRGITQGSIIIAPEGMYVIRQIKWDAKLFPGSSLHKRLHNFILKLELKAIKKYENTELSDPDVFHNQVGSDFYFIGKINRFLSDYNIFIEYYPREKKNGEWYLRPMSLMIVLDP